MNRPTRVRGLLLFTLIPLLLASVLTAAAQDTRAFRIGDMFEIDRVGDPQLSPDGKQILFVVSDVILSENRTNSDIWIVPAAGGTPDLFASSPKSDHSPRWSPDGKTVAFVSARGGSPQIWTVPAGGGDPKQLTGISTGASQPVWSPDGSQIAFVSAVYPQFSGLPFSESDKRNADLDHFRDTARVKARIFTQLLYRHWDSPVDDKRLHIFVVPSGGGEPRDVTPGERDAVPTSSTFSAGDDFAWSPDGAEIAYTATPLPLREQAWRTNHDILTVDLATGTVKQLTTNPAADGFPRYSPDGKYIAYRAQSVPDFEADRWQLMLHDRTTGSLRSLTTDFDTNVDAFCWGPDSRTIFLDAGEKANGYIWSLEIGDPRPRKITPDGVSSSVNVGPDGKWLVFDHRTFNRPPEIYSIRTDGSDLVRITDINGKLFGGIEFSEPETAWFTGSGGTRVQTWIIKPPFFDPAKKYPLVYIVHGGPQGAWTNSWSYRWNPSLWAAQGYVVALPNPRGSTTFGQRFTDEISRDWGGRVYEDLMAGVDYMASLPYVDSTRMAAAGASYGGYMMNWMMGHTDRFRTFVVHDGVYNFYSMYGTTEEVWFDEYEHGIPWETPDFDKYSPHKYAANFNTPALIIHGELDYRVPLTEGQQLFTTLQRRGIPSKFLYFPDEGHWVLKPANSEFWHRTVFGWLAEYLK